MDLSKLKNLIKGNDKFIVIENGEPELVILSFAEYEKLIAGKPESAPRTVEEPRRPFYQPQKPERADYQPSVAHDPPELPRHISSIMQSRRENLEVVEAGIPGLPVRLEDIHLEDLPI